MSNRINNVWNSLSTNVRASENLTSFKKNVDRELVSLTFEFDE